ncbi:2-hydroxyacid dehydrogenase [Dokdonia sp. Hel_I_53]|uniref:2-hydroxyacid dehydrogenase n=1 Tax=Dokdonia sp. Hel_I_53 TaxID=1566287 RepID=UPI00119B8394|nr:2-hydroxyacid dehydrogenase [Dokdonia sp. Hel_I_53]TVZ52494.1 D-3-phosphoglycerate dehydrogenase [Dokdonia sp. Hel_I_53]
MKILHLDKNHPLLVDQLTDAGHTNDENYKISKAETEKIIGMYDGIVIRSRFKIDRLFIDAATNLKFIARVGAGLESIDVKYAKEKGIYLINSPEGNRNAVGEQALGMLLNLFNNINRADREVKAGHWNREQNRGVELEGKTVGIIGYGNMGKAFAKKLKGFDCNVVCYDLKNGLGDENARQVSLTTLQKEADVLSLHTPWTPKTDQMVDSNFINAFAKAFYLINTARGKSVVTKDLVAAMKDGKILGAGLDVLEYENLSFENLFTGNQSIPVPLEYLIKQDNVILTPHIAGWTIESKVKLSQTIVDKILARF